MSGERKKLNVRYNSQNPISIDVDPDWTISRLKNEIGQRANIPAPEVRIIFQGKELADIVKIKHCDLGNGSILNAIKGRQSITLDAVRRTPLESLAEIGEQLEEPDTSAPPAASEASDVEVAFYVYCKNPCQKLQAGKIRVRCKKCHHGAFELERDPQNFTDVMEPNKMQGRCHQENCDGKYAEFYFKCKSHDTGEFDTSSPLSLVRSNTKGIECAVCVDIANPVLLFPCASQHVMCVPCFSDYCTVKLNERGFIQDKVAGYTLPCPGTDEDCDKAYIKEGHHFRIMGAKQYERYQRFGTEEFILQNGGVLCPNTGCGVGILPDNPNQREITCVKDGDYGCGFKFCRKCSGEYHTGDCGNSAAVPPASTRADDDHFRLDEDRANRARWNEESKAKIEEVCKNCPQCKVPIEKNDGCMHMTCARCRFGFCWICLIEWNRTCQGNHWFGE